ncbi:hypothetical protein ACMZ5F_11365 [Streptomyces rhizosphaericola]|uniref:hypothetical protein n=1 Tax=Streptomyces rhizosphaericola TaxID=2564098 RepID=UPI0039EF157E
MSDDKDPVRVGRFDWERLMIMSDLPEPDRYKLLAVAIFMSADGSNVRPGNNGLAHFGPHADTWKKLLQRTTKAGWLLQMERGGARRGPNGTTIRRASVYAASVPKATWERRHEVLNSPPFRSAAFEGGVPSVSESGKGAPDAPLQEGDSLKGAPETPFKGADPVSKGAPSDPLQEEEGATEAVLKGAPGVSKGAPDGFEGGPQSFEGGTATPPHQAVSPSISSSSTSTTSGAGLPADTNTSTEVAVTEGGGGGGSSSLEEITNETQRAQAFVDSLPKPGQPPRKQQLEDLPRRVLAAFQRGWSEGGLYRYLDISDVPDVRSAASLYLYRLRDDQLPDNEVPPALTGTDAKVAGWAAIAASFGDEETEHLPPGHRPSVTDQRVRQALETGARMEARYGRKQGYTGPARPNTAWNRIKEEARLGLAPDGAEKYPHCGSVDCDPITRTVEKIDWQGLKQDSPCPQCHPSMRF